MSSPDSTFPPQGQRDQGDQEDGKGGLSRRDFLRRGALAGAGLMLAPAALRAQKTAVAAEAANAGRSSDVLNIAVIGCGVQGGILLDTMLGMPGVRIRALCDVWPYALDLARDKMAKAERAGEARCYQDYEELLEKEQQLDGVIIATPDFWHAPQTIACLKAGLHVYCEKVMSNTVEGARSMVRAMRETGKLLQIGHQRRSNPRYRHAVERLIKEIRLPGRITAVRAQWNHCAVANVYAGTPKGTELPVETLKRYGYPSMRHLRRWREYREYAGGPVYDLGAHQLDIFNWVLGVRPTVLHAHGGTDYFTGREQCDNVIAVYEYPTPEGLVRALYQVVSTTTAGGGGMEYFMGDEGTVITSENPRFSKAYREGHAPDWAQWVSSGDLVQSGKAGSGGGDRVDIRETMALDEFTPALVLDKPIYYHHLENFFDAIKGKAKLNLDGARALESEGILFPINATVAGGKPYRFEASDFEA